MPCRADVCEVVVGPFFEWVRAAPAFLIMQGVHALHFVSSVSGNALRASDSTSGFRIASGGQHAGTDHAEVETRTQVQLRPRTSRHDKTWNIHVGC